MKKVNFWYVLLALILAVILIALALNNYLPGTYYLYRNDELDTEHWITLDSDKSWIDSDGLTGTYTNSKNNITIYWNGITIAEGSIQNGRLTITVYKTEKIYYKEHSVPKGSFKSEYSRGLTYSYNADDKTYSVSGIGFCKDTEIKIPATHLNREVTKINDRAFYDCLSIASVDMPDTITIIGSNAFSGCTNLATVNIPNGVTSIGNWAFNNCSSLLSINLPSNLVSIGRGAFEGCSSITKISIPNNITNIEASTFSECSKLNIINLPSNLISIGNAAFQGCSSLEEIDIPNSVTFIGEYAFISSGLSYIPIPQSINSISDWAFHYCNQMHEIIIPEHIEIIGNHAFEVCNRLTSITIPSSVKSIGSSAFLGCQALTEVIYNGTKEEWRSIAKGSLWDDRCPFTVVHCIDGDEAPGW